MPWLELQLNIRRRGDHEPIIGMVEVTVVDDAPNFIGLVMTEAFRMELPRNVPDEAYDVWATAALRQAAATFGFNRTIRRLPQEKRRELQPSLFDESFEE